MTMLLVGMLAGALLVLVAALASIWLQQTRATRAEVDAEAPAEARPEGGP
jgi:hypothetical protein